MIMAKRLFLIRSCFVGNPCLFRVHPVARNGTYTKSSRGRQTVRPVVACGRSQEPPIGIGKHNGEGPNLRRLGNGPIVLRFVWAMGRTTTRLASTSLAAPLLGGNHRLFLDGGRDWFAGSRVSVPLAAVISETLLVRKGYHRIHEGQQDCCRQQGNRSRID
jgi:hypothetical protein